MIEENILEWLDLGDSIQKLDVYTSSKIQYFYNYHYLILKNNIFGPSIFAIFIFLYFGQIWCINIIHINKKGDFILEIIYYLHEIFLLHKIVKDKNTNYLLNLIMIIISIYTNVVGILLIILLFMKKTIRFFYVSLAFIHSALIYYLICPSLNLILYPILCKNGINVYSHEKCFSTIIIIVIVILGFLYGIFLIIGSFSISLFMDEIGNINGPNTKTRVNCKFTTISTISIIIMTIISFFYENYYNEKSYIITIFYHLYLILNCIILSIYVYKNVYYYNNLINNFFHYGWYFTTWYSICIFLKFLFNIEDISIFIILGLILIGLTVYFGNKLKTVKLITEFNILEGNRLKDIENFNTVILELFEKKDQNSKILVAGVIKRFEEYIRDIPELIDQYKKLLNDKNLRKKFTLFNQLPLLSIIYIIYVHNIEKSTDKIDITLKMCYFLVNNFKNPTFAMFLCSKLKTNTFIQFYYKYILCEQINEYFITKLNKNVNKDSIKHIQISSPVLYYQLVDSFKIKIYDAACNQIDYFDLLKNSNTTASTTQNFLKIGDEILKLRKEILSLWEKLILLNPFNNESEKDFILYLDTILQDDLLLHTEEKKFNELKTSKLHEKNDLYYTLFIQDLTAIVLADGYSYNCKIFYTTPNFQTLFSFSGKELLNTSVDDLLPDALQHFHKYLIEDAIRFSNVQYKYKNKRDILVKAKSGNIYNAYLFVKPLPKLSYGLIYFCYLEKFQEQNFIFVLDSKYIINGFTGMNSNEIEFTSNKVNNYGLSQNIIGHHISEIIPDILLQLRYDKFTDTFFISKQNIDLKGSLYFNIDVLGINDKINKILNLIKIDIHNNRKEIAEEYENLIIDLNAKNQNTFSIFYRFESHTFIGGKYKYNRLYITNDLLSTNDNLFSTNNKNILKSNHQKENNINTNMNETSNRKSLKKENMEFLSRHSKTLKEDSFSNLNYQKLIQLKIPNRQSSLFNKEINKEINIETNINIDQEIKNNIDKRAINIFEEKKGNSEDSNAKNILKREEINKNNENQHNITFDNNKRESITNQSTMNTNEFNKLKNSIINKSDSFYIKIMKYLLIVYIILIIALIVYEVISNKKVLNLLMNFLFQNYFSGRMKINTACLYISGLNLKWIKYGIINENNCDYRNCSIFYSKLLNHCINDIKVKKSNVTEFFSDYKPIMQQKTLIYLDIYDNTKQDILSLSLDNIMNLLISNGLKILANLNSIITNYDYIDDFSLFNLINQSFNFFYSNYSHFSQDVKIQKAKTICPITSIRLILFLILFFVIFCIFSYFILKYYKIEYYLLDKLINFNSNHFEEYLKKLNELKKKFRDSSNEEDDKNLEDTEINEIGVISKNNDDEINNIHNKKIKIENDENKKHRTRKHGNKKFKIHQQKIKKKEIMSKYFLKWNLIYGIEIAILLVASITYFSVSSIILSYMRNKYLEMDNIKSSITDVFYNSFNICLLFEAQLAKYEEDIRKNNTPNMIIPEIEEIETPTLGNLLNDILNNKNLNQTNIKLLSNLFYGDACTILFESENDKLYCQSFWSAILQKGIEQAIIQMSVIISSSIDELNTLKEGSINLTQLLLKGSSYSNYETFVVYYLYLSYLETVETFNYFFTEQLKYMIQNLMNVLKFYYFIYPVLFIILLIVIYRFKTIYDTFLNFIVIVPSKFIIDDDNFHKSIVNLEQQFY